MYYKIFKNDEGVKKKREPLGIEARVARALLSVWVTLFFLQPTLSKQAFQLFTCVPLSRAISSKTKDRYLADDMSVQCFTPSHFGWMIG